MPIDDEVRRICLSLPEALEQETWGHPTFRVRGKVFAAMGNPGPDQSLSFKADAEDREALLAGGDPWFVPAYVGRYGWLAVRLVPDLDLEDLRQLITFSWRSTAPKRLVATFDDVGDDE